MRRKPIFPRLLRCKARGPEIHCRPAAYGVDSIGAFL